MKLFIDLECNGAEKQEIIEIGATLNDNKFRHRIDYKIYVKPNEPVIPYVENLTGIRNERLEKAPSFEKALKDMVNWLRNVKPALIKECGDTFYDCYAWGDDFKLLRRQAKEYGCLNLFNELFPDNHRHDYQKQFSKNVLHDGKLLTKRVSLTDAKRLLNIEHETEHDALADAVDTANVYRQFEYNQKKLNSNVLNEMYQEKKAHMDKMENAKKEAAIHYFDFVDEYPESFMMDIDNEMFRLLKSGPTAIFNNISSCVKNKKIFSRGKECTYEEHSVKLGIVIHHVEALLKLDIVVLMNNNSLGYFRICADDENKAFLKKFLKKGLNDVHHP